MGFPFFDKRKLNLKNDLQGKGSQPFENTLRIQKSFLLARTAPNFKVCVQNVIVVYTLQF